MVCGGPPCDPTFVLVVCCDAAGEFCAVVVWLELFVLGVAGGREVVVLENVGELLCEDGCLRVCPSAARRAMDEQAQESQPVSVRAVQVRGASPGGPGRPEPERMRQAVAPQEPGPDRA